MINKKLEEDLLEAEKRIQQLKVEVARREDETGFIRPRLTLAHKIFQTHGATFCSYCLSFCTSIDLLKCGHYLCFQCQISNFPCKLCNAKEEYGKIELIE